MAGAEVKVGFLEVKVTEEVTGITELGQTALVNQQTDREVPDDTGRGAAGGIKEEVRKEPIR